MGTNEIRNIDEAVEFVASIQKTGIKYIFRGHSRMEYNLIPLVGREGVKDEEQDNFQRFKKLIEAHGYFEQPFLHNDFRTLGLAQHAQYCPTRLLDWTSSILIALYFSCKENHNQDGAVWSFPLPCDNDSIWLNQYEEKTMSPFSFNEFKIFICGSFVDNLKTHLNEKNIQLGNNRDLNQRSIMTLHPKKENGEFGNLEDLSRQYNLRKFLVPKNCKKPTLDSLAKAPHWITNETLIDGKSAQELKSEEKWREIMDRMYLKGGV
jgi:hypothetical protein